VCEVVPISFSDKIIYNFIFSSLLQIPQIYPGLITMTLLKDEFGYCSPYTDQFIDSIKEKTWLESALKTFL